MTDTVDRRVYCGRPVHAMRFEKDSTLTATNTVYSSWPFGSYGYILPTVGVFLSLGAAGSTSGSTICDLEQSNAGASFTTIFTSQGTSDQRPTIAHSTSNAVDYGARPEVFTVYPWSRWRGVVDAVPGTASTDLSLTVLAVPVDA